MNSQANGSAWHINLVDYNNYNDLHIDGSNVVAVYHVNEQTQFDKSYSGASIGYSSLRDDNSGINIDSSSNSQQSVPDTVQNHKNDGKQNNGNGISTKNGDIPFTLPFP